MRIVLDMVPLIYSQSAERRTTFHLYRELLARDRADEFALLCVARRRSRAGCEALLAVRKVPVRRIPVPFRVMEWGWTHLRWPTVERLAGEADVYHAASMHAPPADRAAVLLTVRGIAWEAIPHLLPAPRVEALRRTFNASMRHADYFLAVSATTKDDLVKYLGVAPEKIFVVNHGVDPIFRQSEDRQALAGRLAQRFGIERPYVLYVGAIGRHKNVMGLLEAYRKLHTLGLGAYDLWLVGAPDSVWEEARVFAARQGFQGRVHFPGAMDQESRDLTDLYGGASCCVFPSFYEGWCSPPVEAMACGSPVVAADRSSLPETTGGAALLTDPDDPARIAEDVARVLTDDALRGDLVRRGLERAAQLTWGASAERLMGVYRRIERERA